MYSALDRRPTLTVADLNRGSFIVSQAWVLTKVLQWFGEKLSMALGHSFLCSMTSHAHALYSLVAIRGAIGCYAYATCFGRTLLSRIVACVSVGPMETERGEERG